MPQSIVGNLLLACGAIVTVLVIAVAVGQARENTWADYVASEIIQSAPSPAVSTVDFNSLAKLPPPVARYFRHVLKDGQKIIATASISQQGRLRSSTTTHSWSSFTAQQLVVPPALGFIWNARVEMPLGTHVRIIDSYSAGVGTGRLSLLSAFVAASATGRAEINSGELHRYLAEGVWFPTALLSQSGVVWTPIDEHAALATLTHYGITVSLEFTFNEADEISGIYTAGRFGVFAGSYKRVPWEGHFSNYEIRGGMRIPLYGEVGWYVDGELHLVWQGELVDVDYDLVP